MNSVHLRARAAGFAALLTAAAWLALLSCSSDPAGTLGSDSDILGSEPGKVSQQFIDVFADTVYAFDTPIATDTDLEVGTDSLYTHTIIVQPGFANLQAGDVNRTVQTASLHLTTTNVASDMPVRFYRTGAGHTYNEGNAVTGLDTLTAANAILDPIKNTIERILTKSTGVYPIPVALAQDWIRDSKKREAIVIIYTDNVNDRVATIPARETEDGPYLDVRYTDGTQRAYRITHDATAYRPNSTTSNLIVSDGYPRRVFVNIAIDSLTTDSAVHSAKLRFHVVPNSLLGTTLDNSVPPKTIKGIRLLLYIPDSPDPATPAFKTGQRIVEVLVEEKTETVQFAMTNAIFLILQGNLKKNGFAIRAKDENTQLRQIAFYGTGAAADSLKPTCSVTTSQPADFH